MCEVSKSELSAEEETRGGCFEPGGQGRSSMRVVGNTSQEQQKLDFSEEARARLAVPCKTQRLTPIGLSGQRLLKIKVPRLTGLMGPMNLRDKTSSGQPGPSVRGFKSRTL